jgi:hypothetical protein
MRRAAPLLFATGGILVAPMVEAPSDTLEFKGAPGTVTPNLAVGASGRTILTWLEPNPSGSAALRFAVRTAGRWSAPATIVESDRFFVNWADFPSLIETADGQWVVHFLEKTEAKPYAYHVRLMTSKDQGRTWSAPFTAHDDTSPTEHGFVAMVPRPEAGADLVWLDGRAMGGPEGGPMSIRTRPITSVGKLGTETELDGRSCECCQATMARTPDGLVAAYRDRSEAEVRDIALVRQVGGRWTEPTIVAADGWVHRACPVNGPSLAADGRDVALTWYTGVGDTPHVYTVLSHDGGATFGPRVQVNEGVTLGRVASVGLGDGAFAALWLEDAGEGQAVWRLRRIDRSGRAGPARDVERVTRARLAGFPRIVRSGAEILLTFTASGADGGIRVYRVTPPPASPGS